MEQPSLPTEVILQASQKSLGNVYLDWTPQPGAYLNLEGQTYTVLERRHRYQFKAGRYRLHKIAIYVQSSACPEERSLVEGRWVMGDASCQYNARSELLRCAVNALGPCQGCRFYTPRE
ncbi:MAG: hypothetical protein B0A82_25735 [Alkalinema sp. CACIAM 70d]|nr:MAG: hypothetical protein B0A82_25735 [Alkalinema sp. CACIAM 70d]